MKVSRKKLFLIGYISLIIAGFLSWYIHRTLTRAGAATDNVTITFAPTAGTFGIGQQSDIDVLIQTADGSKKISGLDLTFTASGMVQFTNITDPVPFPGTDTSLFNQVLRSVSDQEVHIAYVSFKPDIELPSVIKLRLSFQGSAEGTGTIAIDQSKVQVVGTIAGKIYGIGQADTGTYTFTAGGATTALSARIEPASFTVGLGQTADVALAITDVPTGSSVSGYDFTIQYNPAIIEIMSIDPPYDAATGTDSNKFTELRKEVDPAAGTIRLAYIVSLPAAQLPIRPKQVIHIMGKQVGGDTLQIIAKQVVGPVGTVEYTVNVFNSSYQVAGVAPTVTIPTPTAIPPTPTAQPTGGPATCTTDSQCSDNQLCSAGACVDLPCQAVTGACTYTVPKNHTCLIEYAANGSACGGGGVCQNGVCMLQLTPEPTLSTVSPTPYPSVTPYPTATPYPSISQAPAAVTLNLRLKFQGILKRPYSTDPISVKIVLKGPSLGTGSESQTGIFTVDDLGIWSGSVGFNVPPGEGYKVYIKGPQHLQKRICSILPIETAAGTYRCGDTGTIRLDQGQNTLDFSNIVLLSGDVPDQDGVVDAYDIAYLRLNLGSRDAKVLSIGDLNHDGLVDTQDYSLLIASLNVKYDEL